MEHAVEDTVAANLVYKRAIKGNLVALWHLIESAIFADLKSESVQDFHLNCVSLIYQSWISTFVFVRKGG